ncbi:hypothetical protein [Streptomyces nitrosporeus]|uniref:hypothetical protein n=1 Tax=Streptomyces nitrosporeus TaxID=28894 RepID=UPI00142EE22B|nr:hypothetical protein [Streptomyces nitrosporeus]GGY98406.1 hypothetical protein GCM10010327_31120 [Streptomyces nitrosporeus]
MGSTLSKRPWLGASWVLFAVAVVAAWKTVPQPWSAGVYPVVSFVVLLLFYRASSRKE